MLVKGQELLLAMLLLPQGRQLLLVAQHLPELDNEEMRVDK